MYSVYPEYESFTSVEILLTIDGQAGKTFSISRFGEHLQSLTIKEGTVGNGQQLTNPTDIGGGVSSGTVSLYDEDNAIFYSLLESKTRAGQQLLNKLDITVKTYTGIRKYSQCLIEKWSCNFQGGVPIIQLDWRSMGSDSQPAPASPEQPTFNPTLAKTNLVDEGFDSFSDFKGKIISVYNTNLRFCYTETKVVRENLKDIPESGEIVFFSGEERQTGTIYIPDDFLSEENNKKYRMKLQITNDATSFLMGVMNEFVSIAKLKTSGEDQQLQWKFLDGNTVFIYSYKDRGSLSIPEPQGTGDILDNSVFMYNSGYSQGSLYRTPQGDKRVFVIDTISSSFDFNNIIIANLTGDNNGKCPNGNLVLTSRGTLMIPQSVPGEVAANIRKIEGFNLTSKFKVTITVYNFIHFYVMGDTHVHLIVFDHLGNVHPITGDMRVEGYQYDIGEGVVKANVTLCPVLDNAQTTFLGDNGYPSSDSNNQGLPSYEDSQYSGGKADIVVDGSLVSTPTPEGAPPSFLGINVKQIPEAEFFHGKEFRKEIKSDPKWIVVHYSASHSDNAESETKMFARWKYNTDHYDELLKEWTELYDKTDPNERSTKEWNKKHPKPFKKDPVSTHFFCDHRGVYKVVDEKYIAWHSPSSTQQPYKNKKWTDRQIYVAATQQKDDPLSYNKSIKWRYDVPTSNHLIWEELKGKDIPGVDNPFKSFGPYMGGNLNSFGVDLCSNKRGTDKRKDVDATDWYVDPETEENCAKVVAYLCYKYSIPVARVLRHCDCTGKPCLPLYKTEILTPYGFIPLSNIMEGDLVYQYNKTTNTLEETSVISVVIPHVATVCRNREYETTLNHRTLYRDINGDIHTEYLECIIPRLNKESIYLYTSFDEKTFYPSYKLSKEFYFYNDVVSCIEVPSGYIVIRQNNTVFVTGNCPRPMVAMPSDGNMKNELKWKILRDRNTKEIISPEQYNVDEKQGIWDYSYSYDPRKHILDLEENIGDPSKRTSFLGKVAGYISVLKVQGFNVTVNTSPRKSDSSSSSSSPSPTPTPTPTPTPAPIPGQITSNQVMVPVSDIPLGNYLSSTQVNSAITSNNKEGKYRKFRSDWVGRLYSMFGLSIPQDHYFNEELVQAIASFQKSLGIKINGIIDSNTRSKIEARYSVLFDYLFGDFLEERVLVSSGVSVDRRYTYYKSIIEAQGGVFLEDGTPNILGIRGASKKKDGSVVQSKVQKNIHFNSGSDTAKTQPRYDDIVITLWKNGTNYIVKEFTGSADPGSAGEYTSTDPYGTAHLRDGQYEYKIGLHKGYTALVNASTVEIIRTLKKGKPVNVSEEDFSCSVSEIYNRRESMVSPNTAVHIHKAANSYTQSQGCQNIPESIWPNFLDDLVNIKRSMYYTLIDASKILVTL